MGMVTKKAKKFTLPSENIKPEIAKWLAKEMALEGTAQAAGAIRGMLEGESFRAALLSELEAGAGVLNIALLLEAAKAGKYLSKANYKEAAWMAVEAGTKQTAYAAATGMTTAAATSIAYAGIGGTFLKAGVFLGFCNPPALVVWGPLAVSSAVVISISWLFRQRRY